MQPSNQSSVPTMALFSLFSKFKPSVFEVLKGSVPVCRGNELKKTQKTSDQLFVLYCDTVKNKGLYVFERKT